MKKSVYAVCGSLMIVAAVCARVTWEGGPQLVGLLMVGVVTLIASADLPVSQKGRVR